MLNASRLIVAALLAANAISLVAQEPSPDDWATAYVSYLAGVTYHTGDGVEQDYEAAMKYYREAADLGSAEALYAIGTMYHSGTGVPQNVEIAVDWYTKAASRGVVDAFVNLGSMYSLGQAGPVDYGKAVEWYLKAADQKSVSALYNLAAIDFNGDDQPQNLIEALKWSKLALAYANQQERQAIEEMVAVIEEEMTPEQIQAAGALVVEVDPELKQVSIDWADRLGPSATTWSEAAQFCEDLGPNDGFQWRLPTLRELKSRITVGSTNDVPSRLDGPYAGDFIGYIFSSSIVEGRPSDPYAVNIRNSAIFNASGQQGYAWCVHEEPSQ